MRHLFIINPRAARVKGHVQETIDHIESFFRAFRLDNYDIHVSRFARDCMGYVNRYVKASPGIVRVHSMGGSGTAYEVINAMAGLANVQVALYPMGNSNYCVRYFGRGNEQLFMSLRNQVFSDVVPIDILRHGNIYGISFALIGVEALASINASKLQRKFRIKNDILSFFAALDATLKIKSVHRNYNIIIDGTVQSGKYASILIAGGPCYGNNLTPALASHPNDGFMDIYLTKTASPLKLMSIIRAYTKGRHEKLDAFVKHIRGKEIMVSADKEIAISIDGEGFFERKFVCKNIPAAIDLVCPDDIDVNKLPRVYNESRTLNEALS